MALSDARRARGGGGGVRLRCGRTVDGLWELVSSDAAEPDAHVAGCPYCRSALAGLRPLRSATDALLAERVQAPPSLFGTVMRVVRTAAHRGETVALHGGPDAARVSVRAVAALVRAALDAQAGLVPVSVQIEAGAELGLLDVAVVAELAGAAPTGAGELEAQLRRSVDDALRGGLGLRLGRLRVQVRPTGDPP